MHATDTPKRKAVIAAVQLPGVSDVEHAGDVAELERLLKTLGYQVVGIVSQRRSGVGAAAVFGAGKLLELAGFTGGTGVVPSFAPKAGKGGGRAGEKARAAHQDGDDDEDEPVLPDAPEEPDEDEEGQGGAAGVVTPVLDADGAPVRADVVVVDHEISPRQARNLEKATEAEVIDRTGVIVEIFHRHAQTREARLQVEIARLAYVVPRLRYGVKGTERQQGKGAGESELELDKRRVRDRIAELKAELAAIARDEENRRSRRKGVPRVALVGYTNAGKSSLMRALTSSQVYVEDKLFATLGTTVRALHPETTPRILISDTVGFIKKLPHDLVASFRSTLDEALEASLLLHVVDASDPDFRSQLAVTRSVLDEIGADAVPSRLVLNKVDRIDADTRLALGAEYPEAIQLSAHEPADVAALRETIIAFFEADFEEVVLHVPWARGTALGTIRAAMRVVAETWDDAGTLVTVRAPKAEIDKVRALLR
jgi:GTP-binding protein HflX